MFSLSFIAILVCVLSLYVYTYHLLEYVLSLYFIILLQIFNYLYFCILKNLKN